MSSRKIRFFKEQTSFPIKNSSLLKERLLSLAAEHGYTIRALNYIFCDDEYLLQMNEQYLRHDTLTDILTFDHSESPTTIEGDIFISAERVKENAQKFKTTFENELSRVMAHGLLHLMGYRDKTPSEKSAMRAKEEAFLTSFS